MVLRGFVLFGMTVPGKAMEKPLHGKCEAGFWREGDAGMLEYWDAGMLECWNAGMLECWDAGMLLALHVSIIPG